MLGRIIGWSLARRWAALALSAALLIWGALEVRRMPVDVFPDLTAPTVTVLAEAHGMAPREVETQIVLPIEGALSGVPGVRRVRSIVSVGSGVIHADFDWGTDSFRARQLVAEKLQLARSSLPADLPAPILAPQSSIMGEILFVPMTSGAGTAAALRTEADWRVRRRLLAVPGVAEVLVVGGDQRQYQVVVRPERLAAYRLTLDDVAEATRNASGAASEGLVVAEAQQYVVQGLARARNAEDLAQTVVAVRDGSPVLLRDLAEVRVGRAIRRGAGSYNAQPAVVIGVQKQPGADTLELTKTLDATIAQLQRELPAGMTIRTDGFRQAGFITTAIDNLRDALLEGLVLVVGIVFLFLMSGRATLVTLAAIPLSVVSALLVLRYTGAGVNTMTLGGLAIALGALVDDAIIVVENVTRRLRLREEVPEDERAPVRSVIFEAVREIQGSILFATLIILLVFLPLFGLEGVEGRLLAPLALAYVVALAASFLVAVTATPALCSVLLPGSKAARAGGEGAVYRWVKHHYARLLDPLLARWRLLAGASAALLVASGLGVAFAARGFLPEFSEGVFTVSAVTLPGTSLDQSDAIGRLIEQTLHQLPEVRSTVRRTGRAELDEHAQSVEAAEIDVTLKPDAKRTKEEVLAEMRQRLAGVRGVNVVIGQPISHRIDHMLSGTRSAIAIKIFGPELDTLRRVAEQVEPVAKAVPGMADVAIEPQTQIPALTVAFDRGALALSGLSPAQAATALDMATAGEEVGRVIEGAASYDVAVRYPDAAAADPTALAAATVPTATGALVPFSALGEVRRDRSANMIGRENGERLIVIQANSSGRDLVGTVEQLQRQVAAQVRLPPGYRIEYGGQFESASSASSRLLWLGLAAIAGIYLLLFAAFRSHRDAGLVMLNLPLALVGGVVGMWIAGGVLSVATIVGFITLFGIATRNGVMLVSHIRWLVDHGEAASHEEAVRTGAIERVVPILMTALAAGLGLLPLALASGQPGSEIQAPMAVVILFGLISSTALNMLVVPALYLRFGAAGRAPPVASPSVASATAR